MTTIDPIFGDCEFEPDPPEEGSVNPCGGCHARSGNDPIAGATVKVKFFLGSNGKCNPAAEGGCSQEKPCNLNGVVTVTSAGGGFRIHRPGSNQVVVIPAGDPTHNFASVPFDLGDVDCGSSSTVVATVHDAQDTLLGSVFVRCGGC